ncbi:hypothetical protein AB434_2574 [Heyndrickxia coagulans]|uniref:Uncharacterized protein n=1 Tax=Heyndrickxia coagulans TaxID=1398 RepID=A0A0C5C9I3_HEYCO|nr:hypothetical protein SB48_HM08orf04344 [Heyndrickxia coagulans]AKN54979.1 hypothetical protein AB434_2574 [Heyndrickxia coagulans]KWZ77174.1 hypothetical protein HMPREF3213_03363 [Heyndrickxia coagulans]KYC61629.1 hypothetical protein B4100_0130 [Heyndrickxia coagulans]KYC90418.1 hypothetical protein B4096_0082 [Heyndrickxia coagulans]
MYIRPSPGFSGTLCTAGMSGSHCFFYCINTSVFVQLFRNVRFRPLFYCP